MFTVGVEAAKTDGPGAGRRPRGRYRGFGNVGGIAAKLFAEAGAKGGRDADHTGTIFNRGPGCTRRCWRM